MQEFSLETKNAAIFRLTAPYNNPYQGSFPRWLFVCSAGLLRSPTGATMAARRRINARACGSVLSYALIPISANLVAWADKIVFVCPEVKDFALNTVFVNSPEIRQAILYKEQTLDIPDMYEYMHPDLMQCFETELFEPLGYPALV